MKQQKDFIYGKHPVLEHLEDGGSFEQILLQKGIDREFVSRVRQLARERNIPTQVVPIQRMNRVTRKNHQGVIAFTAFVEYRDIVDEVQHAYESRQVPLVLVLDRITDVRNMGAIARSAEIFGATAIVIPARDSARINSDAVKTSAGAILKIPVCRVDSLIRAVEQLKEMGLGICVAAQSQDSGTPDFVTPTAIVLGSEHSGVDIQIRRLADSVFSIPQIGTTDSLNVSVAAGISLYEAVKQREQTD